jgi:hypothetical protein
VAIVLPATTLPVNAIKTPRCLAGVLAVVQNNPKGMDLAQSAVKGGVHPARVERKSFGLTQGNQQRQFEVLCRWIVIDRLGWHDTLTLAR